MGETSGKRYKGDSGAGKAFVTAGDKTSPSYGDNYGKGKEAVKLLPVLTNKDREGLIQGRLPSGQLRPADSKGQMLQANNSNVQAARRHTRTFSTESN